MPVQKLGVKAAPALHLGVLIFSPMVNSLYVTVTGGLFLKTDFSNLTGKDSFDAMQEDSF